ncbi:unnamed protein product [Rhizophagus irregularis]|nr:unnamed protein product [Rhizophagus irregularis]
MEAKKKLGIKSVVNENIVERQDLVEKFVSQCNICVARLTRIRPLTRIPIIEQKFMLRLQSDNGKEFVSSIIIELVNLWPTIQIINGRPKHPASQSLVERANGILETKLEK